MIHYCFEGCHALSSSGCSLVVVGKVGREIKHKVVGGGGGSSSREDSNYIHYMSI